MPTTRDSLVIGAYLADLRRDAGWLEPGAEPDLSRRPRADARRRAQRPKLGTPSRDHTFEEEIHELRQ